MRFGEDIDFSIRIFKSGARCRLFPEAWVWHQRRTDFRKFWRQVYNSGIARINLYKKYPESLKLVHLLPAVFTLGVTFCVLMAIICLALSAISGNNASLWLALSAMSISPIILYCLLLCIDSSVQNRSAQVGLLSIPAAFVQLGGYGCGFLSAWWKRCVCGKDEFQAFEKTFYK